MDKYFYLIWGLIFLVIWLLLFILRKDTRKEMTLVSIFFGFSGLVCQKTNIQDYWQPLTITGTKIGIEDFLLGFALGGVAAVIYEEIYHKRLRKNRSSVNIDSGFHLLLFPLLYLNLFYVFNIGSAYSILTTYILCLGYIWFKRRDLISDSIFSGIWMMVIGIGIYFILFNIKTDYIHQFWYLRDNWYSKLLLGIPIGEYIFYFLTGAYIGPMYEFLDKRKLASAK